MATPVARDTLPLAPIDGEAQDSVSAVMTDRGFQRLVKVPYHVSPLHRVPSLYQSNAEIVPHCESEKAHEDAPGDRHSLPVGDRARLQ